MGNGWQNIPLLYGGIIRLDRYYCLMEGYSMTSERMRGTLLCRALYLLLIALDIDRQFHIPIGQTIGVDRHFHVPIGHSSTY